MASEIVIQILSNSPAVDTQKLENDELEQSHDANSHKLGDSLVSTFLWPNK